MSNPELRMTMYEGHVKHAKIWKYKPLDWHTWKFRVWPEFDSDVTLAEATRDVILFAMRLATKKRDN